MLICHPKGNLTKNSTLQLARYLVAKTLSQPQDEYIVN